MSLIAIDENTKDSHPKAKTRLAHTPFHQFPHGWCDILVAPKRLARLKAAPPPPSMMVSKRLLPHRGSRGEAEAKAGGGGVAFEGGFAGEGVEDGGGGGEGGVGKVVEGLADGAVVARDEVGDGVEAVGGFLYSRNMETLVLALETTGGDIEIPAGVKYIGSFAFGEECQVTSMVLPEGLLSLGDFALCFSGVSTLTVPESVEVIGAGVFRWCPGVKTLYVPSSWKDTTILDDSGGVPPGCKVIYVPTRAERRYADWVREWGADPEDLPASGDKDGDGVPNWDEFLAGTNPLDPADTLQASIRTVDGHLWVQPLHAASGRVYRVSGTSRLVPENGDPPVWSSVDSDTPLEDGELRFFRVGAELAEE